MSFRFRQKQFKGPQWQKREMRDANSHLWEKDERLEINFRSRYEYNYSLYLDILKERGLIANWLYEPCEFWFPVKRGTKNFKPDFMLIYPDKSVVFIEVKGWMRAKDLTRLRRFNQTYPDLTCRLFTRQDYEELERRFGHLIGWRKCETRK